MKSTKSGAALLAGMCWSLEYGAGASVSHAQAGAWVSALVGQQPGDPR